MLYELREVQRAWLGPVAEWANAVAKLYENPYSPFAHVPFARRMSAGLQLLHRLGKEYEKPRFDIESVTIDGHEVSVAEVIDVSKPFCRLIHFEKRMPRALAGRPAGRRVLVVAPLSGHHATLLRDTVRTLLPDHDVWITDWLDARLVPTSEGPFHLDDYVGYVIEFMRALGPGVDVMAVCQPTVPVLAAVSIMAALGDPMLPRTMTLMGGPIDPTKSPTQVNELATTRDYRWFEQNLIYPVPATYPGAGRRVYPGFLQHLGFVAMNPERHVTSHWDFYLDLVRGDHDDADAHRRFYDEYNAVLDMAAEYYLETVKTVFQEHALARGTWDVSFGGRVHRVDPSKIADVALLTVEGQLDDISGPGQTHAAVDMCASIPAEKKRAFTAEGVGHYGIFSGRRWREVVYPVVAEFIRQGH
jgi:poly(3-hydroxybutyrate) depolymerase